MVSLKIDWFDLPTFTNHCLVMAKEVAQVNEAIDSCHAGPPQTDRSKRRVLMKRDSLEERMANHSSIPAVRTS